nr:AAA family ATPase [Butyricicoccus sp. AF86-03b2A]
MGIYLNPSSIGFKRSLNSEIYVDKTGLIEKTNALLDTEQKFICVSRPRRFGKSMAVNMLSAYYACGEDSSALFDGLTISHTASYRQHLNQYNVIKVNMQDFLSMTHNMDEMLTMLKKYLVMELIRSFPNTAFLDKNNLIQMMRDIYAETNRSFVVLVDEWDCLFRESQHDTAAQKQYLDFLRSWLKDKDYVALAYMTGILPIKKYGTHSALNMFTEYSMTDPGELAPFFGFTEQEVQLLCENYDMNFDEARAWYDSYELISHRRMGDIHYAMYSPKSVVETMLRHKFGTYWNQTETYEALKVYIQMDMDGLKDAVVEMLAGASVRINTGTFANDMTTFATKDDVLTLLVHLGYLTYDSENETVTIPNKEVSREYVNAISTMDWHGVIQSVQASRELLSALWAGDADAVAKGIDRAHEDISILQYNNENALSCTINLAFYFAREYYTIVRELPTGKGGADICFIPRKLHLDKPAAIIELKWDKSATGALAQIKEKHYAAALHDYAGDLLLVGIIYNRDTKKHECVIEKVQKTS